MCFWHIVCVFSLRKVKKICTVYGVGNANDVRVGQLGLGLQV